MALIKGYGCLYVSIRVCDCVRACACVSMCVSVCTHTHICIPQSLRWGVVPGAGAV